uniref:NADH-ubiquinone oxidoreductase chain 2 n=1 Tax=Leptochiton nexus TaxID=2719131 RepID=A0A6H1PG30_9MOLL|nr:NADH dehydrogenase subunit 2 [Leptochiton nexus]QIZ12590.1 NADH dehydrogenase subunit 2 [Leptochiton nexus]
MINFPFVSLFSFILVLGSVISFSSSHWMGVWFGLELNLMGFVPLMIYSGKSHEVESGLKYFLIQALGSGMILFGGLFLFHCLGNWEIIGDGVMMEHGVMMFGLLLKMGVAPFHFWLPSVMAGLSWMANMILVTWQKVVPLFLLYSFFSFSMVELIFFCLFSSVIGGVGGMNQTSIRALLAYSSIVHLSWLLASSQINLVVCGVYFVVYFVISIMIFFLLWSKEVGLGQQIGGVFMWDLSQRQIFCLVMLSLGGVPPFLGFIGKWVVLVSLLSLGYYLLAFILIFGSLLSFYYYLVLSFSMVMGFMSWKDMMIEKKSMLVVLVVFFNLFGGGVMFWLLSLMAY